MLLAALGAAGALELDSRLGRDGAGDAEARPIVLVHDAIEVDGV